MRLLLERLGGHGGSMVEGISGAAELVLFSRRCQGGGSKSRFVFAWSECGGLIHADLPHGCSVKLSKFTGCQLVTWDVRATTGWGKPQRRAVAEVAVDRLRTDQLLSCMQLG